MKDVWIVGSGPAGLMAAEAAARLGAKVAIAEAKPSPARKFLMAGKSGLNLTMALTQQDFSQGFLTEEIKSFIPTFGPGEVRKWAEDLGQPTFVGSSGRVFPVAMKASPLLRAWMARLADLGVELYTGWRWAGLPKPGEGHMFETPEGPQTVNARSTVLALGGASWSRLGADGAWASSFGQSNVPMSPFKPSNMGFSVGWSAHMTPYFGQPLKQLGLRAGDRSSLGECVLSSTGLEGSGIYHMSQAVRDGAQLFLDLLPHRDLAWITERLKQRAAKKSLSNSLRSQLRLPAIKIALLREWAHPLPNDPIQLAGLIKALPAPNLIPKPMDQAISTAGGVRFDGLTDDLMLKSHPGVFCAGEMLDWDAPTGGYLISACLATGLHAGRAAAGYALPSSARV